MKALRLGLWVAALGAACLLFPLLAGSGSRAYAASTIYLQKYCDTWHYSGGYWIIGNYGTNKYKVSDKEMSQAGFDGIMGKNKLSFDFSLPASVQTALLEGKKVTATAKGTYADLSNNFNESSAEIEMDAASGTGTFSAYPKFNVVPEIELSFADYGLNLNVFVPLIDNANGDNIYSIYGNGVAGGQATGWLAVSSPYSSAGMPAGRLHPSYIQSLNGALKSGFNITIGEKSYTTAGLSVGSGTFQNGGAVGLSFRFDVKISFEIEGEENAISEDSGESLPGSPLPPDPVQPYVSAWLFGTQKQNRLQGINADYICSENYPFWYATLQIENPATGESVKINSGSGSKISKNIKISFFRELIGQDGLPYLSCEFLTKYSESTLLTYTLVVINEAGLKTTISNSFNVEPDLPPTCSLSMETPLYINAESSSAKFTAYSKSVSLDGDILTYSWDIPNTVYNFLKGYNKSAVEFSLNKVCTVPVSLTVTESWKGSTIEKYISTSDYLSASCTVYAQVIYKENSLRIHRIF